MNISHSRFILFKLKIFGEIVTTFDLLCHISFCRTRKRTLFTTASYVEFNFLRAFLLLLMLIACKIGNN